MRSRASVRIGPAPFSVKGGFPGNVEILHVQGGWAEAEATTYVRILTRALVVCAREVASPSASASAQTRTSTKYNLLIITIV